MLPLSNRLPFLRQRKLEDMDNNSLKFKSSDDVLGEEDEFIVSTPNESSFYALLFSARPIDNLRVMGKKYLRYYGVGQVP
ncbi:Hypothetical predicted protein [Octopus vulgaris]|uniref:Uncharacterized protein n=1 Tax=Octopus vulgaris TaxID=6645 RepID=A0AA36B2K7_OCTVU|nr:Hypothetical predicted protein [Octopus vulgaris]